MNGERECEMTESLGAEATHGETVASRRFVDRVALVTGAARGQGRAHALRLAREGADVIATDLHEPGADAAEPLARDLAETVELVRAMGRCVVAGAADVRDATQLRGLVEAGVAQLGRLDVVVANAGIVADGGVLDESDASWDRLIAVNLTGVWHTCRAAVPHLIAGGRGGAIVMVGSTMGVKAAPQVAGYVASKHGVVGLMQTLALELAPHWIRVNVVHPTVVDSPMMAVLAPANLDREELAARYRSVHALPVGWIEPHDVSAAVAFLASDEARYVTGVSLPVDAGALLVSGSAR
jgi:(+)-trans-carveol dehydrogenase